MEQDHTSLLASVKKYEDMLARDPRSCCFAPLAELYCRLGLHDEAMTVVQKGIELHPKYSGGYLAMGKAYLGKGMISESTSALERAVQLTPDNHIALKILGQLYRDTERIDDALVVLHRVLDLNPQDSECRATIDMLMQAKGVTGKKLADSADEIVPQVEDGTFSDDWSVGPDSQCVLSPDDIDGPGRLISPAERDDDPLITPTLAEMYVKQGFADQALDIYRQLLSGDPDNSVFRQRVAQISSDLESGGHGAPGAQLQREQGAGETDTASAPGEAVATGVNVEKSLEEFLVKVERRRTCLSGKY